MCLIQATCGHVHNYILIGRTDCLRTYCVGWRLQMTSLPLFCFLANRGSLPAGSICSVVPKHMLKSDCLQQEKNTHSISNCVLLLCQHASTCICSRNDILCTWSAAQLCAVLPLATHPPSPVQCPSVCP